MGRTNNPEEELGSQLLLAAAGNSMVWWSQRNSKSTDASQHSIVTPVLTVMMNGWTTVQREELKRLVTGYAEERRETSPFSNQPQTVNALVT
ncbi:hypothetical protein MRB53_020354 [Persea americana]|uniref:Uncharacterized protein n=1 Tax=Persea americana TaxID=3435 RepID=A0ACC2L1S8_PERAE|nr:hypothetical protein MRB53_020354 [Persea americana]